jgi:hypothetical protein
VGRWTSVIPFRPLALLAQLLLQTLITFILVCFAVAATMVALALVLVLLVLAILPIPGLSSFVLQLQSILAGFLGDSYVFLISPVRRAAIVSRVRHALSWLASQCRTVAIVAHSQGGAVAHMALRGGLPLSSGLAEVRLITFGSGLGKLESLQHELDEWRQPVALRGYGPLAGVRSLPACDHLLGSRIAVREVHEPTGYYHHHCCYPSLDARLYASGH